MAGLLVALAAGSGDAQESPAATRPAAGCHGAEYRQFDFWIGDWDTYEIADSSKVVARTRVSAFLDGCVLREDYRHGAVTGALAP